MRDAMARVNPALPALVAEQEPVTATERDEAARQVVSHLPEPRSDVLL
jgi:hypothetical protein